MNFAFTRMCGVYPTKLPVLPVWPSSRSGLRQAPVLWTVAFRVRGCELGHDRSAQALRQGDIDLDSGANA